MAKMVLFMYPGACSRVTMSALEEIGLDYEDVTVNLSAGIQQSADYLALNRKGKVPMLSVDGKTLTENASILAYLDRQYPKAGLLPRSAEPLEEARCLSDLIWCSSTVHPEVRQVRAPQKWTVGDPTDIRADGMKKFAKTAAYVAERVQDLGWWYGQQWSIIDVYVYWAYSTAAIGGFPLKDHPRLLAHAERVRARPSFQQALKRELAALRREQLPLEPGSL